MAAVISYLSVPGHPLGTFFFNTFPILRPAVTFAHTPNEDYGSHLLNHISITLISVGLASAICVPLGVIASRIRPVSVIATNVIGIARGIPGIAIMFLMWPALGLGERPAIIALTILASAPIFLNTTAGYAGVDRAVVEAANGMGMSRLQTLLRIETPLAAPVVVAGLRTATVEVIASATIAQFIGFTTLGYEVVYAVDFLNTTSGNQALVLAVSSIAGIALLAEVLLAGMQRLVTPPSG